MEQNKLLTTTAWIAGLTIAAYLLAQAAVMVMSRNLGDSAVQPAKTPQQALPAFQQQSDRPLGARASGIMVEQVSDRSWVLDRASLLANTRDLNRFLMQAQATLYQEEGRTRGYRLTRISPGSLYEKIGLRNNDVLLQINKRHLDDQAKLFSLYQELRNKRHITLLLSRDGQEQTFDYDVR